MSFILKKIFGTAQGRKLKRYQKIVLEVNKIEKTYQALSDDDLKNKTAQFKKRFKEGESLESILPEAFATVKNACRRLIGEEIHVSGYNQKWDMVPYDVQILGAIAIHHGSIAEMQTGEGKTLTSSMPLYLNAITGRAVHLVTVNDYLARRDCEWMRAIFLKLGINTAFLTNDVPPHLRKDIYKADIVYATASEFGFDYLRDNSMATRAEETVQRDPYFAIIDEVDSILIDEARTPLIISGPAQKSTQMYDKLQNGVASLVKLQRELCSKLASEARRDLEGLGILENSSKLLNKEDMETKAKAFKNLWLVGKGTPKNRVLKRIRENPDLREEIEKIETYFYSEQTKQEKLKEIAKLYIVVDERASEYELTDKGIDKWVEYQDSKSDFIMLDLGEEYSKIDRDGSLSPKEKIEKKNILREEDAKRKERSHNLRQLFRAHLLMEKDVDYIVSEGNIVIIDENTGRPQPGRRFSDGLHQAIEAKENVSIQGETQTYATITLQNFFRMYEKLSGMTGTAITEASEFKEIYNLDVLEIPTYCPCIRNDLNDLIYMTEREKYAAIIKEIKDNHSLKRPILIGTESVEISEKLSRILKQNRLPHTVLNAKNHKKEAEIIANAGNISSITIATNMAGRGTDIKLTDEVKNLGGLHVIGCSRHHSRRIDRQLRGRSGRLGDPGSSQFFVSFEDSLMRLFASPRLTSMLKRFRPPEGEAISAKVLNRSVETAQKRIEQRNYNVRKHTLEYDDVINSQRHEIYSFRGNLLKSKDPIALAKELIEASCFSILYDIDTSQPKELPKAEKIDRYIENLASHFPVSFTVDDLVNCLDMDNFIKTKVIDTFDEKLNYQKDIISKLSEDPEKLLNDIVRDIIISEIDLLWQKHLLAIDHLRADVNLRAVGQRDPLTEFKHEAFYLFENFSKKLKLEIAKKLFTFQMIPPKKQLGDIFLDLKKDAANVPQPKKIAPSNDKKEPQKIGRNLTCPCGSGKKYKRCCGS